MSFFDGLHKILLPNARQAIHCQARVRILGTNQLVPCNNVFYVAQGTALPDVPICPRCEKRFNRGIVETIHAHSGKTSGNFHIVDGYKP